MSMSKSTTAVSEKTNSGRMAEKMETLKNSVADKLEKAAETIHEKTATVENKTKNGVETITQYGHQTTDKVNDLGQQAAETAGKYGHKTADMVEASADFVRHAEPQMLKEKIQQSYREHPGKSIVIAGAAGLIIGAMVSRRFWNAKQVQ